jgi:hypothetical protein
LPKPGLCAGALLNEINVRQHTFEGGRSRALKLLLGTIGTLCLFSLLGGRALANCTDLHTYVSTVIEREKHYAAMDPAGYTFRELDEYRAETLATLKEAQIEPCMNPNILADYEVAAAWQTLWYATVNSSPIANKLAQIEGPECPDMNAAISKAAISVAWGHLRRASFRKPLNEYMARLTTSLATLAAKMEVSLPPFNSSNSDAIAFLTTYNGQAYQDAVNLYNQQHSTYGAKACPAVLIENLVYKGNV